MVNVADQFIRIINLALGALIILGGIVGCTDRTFPAIIVGIYAILFGAVVVMTEIWTPSLIMSHLAFLRTFVGRGLTYIFLGCIILRDSGINAFAGGITIGFGILYLIFACIPGMKHPNKGWTGSAGTTTSTTV